MLFALEMLNWMLGKHSFLSLTLSILFSLFYSDECVSELSHCLVFMPVNCVYIYPIQSIYGKLRKKTASVRKWRTFFFEREQRWCIFGGTGLTICELDFYKQIPVYTEYILPKTEPSPSKWRQVELVEIVAPTSNNCKVRTIIHTHTHTNLIGEWVRKCEKRKVEIKIWSLNAKKSPPERIASIMHTFWKSFRLILAHSYKSANVILHSKEHFCLCGKHSSLPSWTKSAL